jgi:hypothetical protein
MKNLHVCGNCFRDESIQRFVRDNAVADQCDFCSGHTDGPGAAPWEQVLAFIKEGLESCWTTEVDDVPFDDDGHCLVRSYDTRELLEVDGAIARELTGIPPIANELVLEEVARSTQTVWYGRPLTEETPYGGLVLQWPDFMYRVIRMSRFFFFTPMEGDPESFEPAQFPTVRLLDELGELVKSTKLIKTLSSGTSFFRARQHSSQDSVDTAGQLGPPPHSKAFHANRMSPAGIVMFYGAYDRQTALQEVYDPSCASEGETKLTVGRFETTVDFKVIDLTQMPPRPSIFDRSNRAIRTGIIFLHQFVEDLKQRASRDGQEHVEYVPTQVITEYFRHAFADQDGDTVRGILYQSSVDLNGVCCVLFFESDQCGGEPNSIRTKPRFQWLRLDTDSIEHSNQN